MTKSDWKSSVKSPKVETLYWTPNTNAFSSKSKSELLLYICTYHFPPQIWVLSGLRYFKLKTGQTKVLVDDVEFEMRNTSSECTLENSTIYSSFTWFYI